MRIVKKHHFTDFREEYIFSVIIYFYFLELFWKNRSLPKQSLYKKSDLA